MIPVQQTITNELQPAHWSSLPTHLPERPLPCRLKFHAQNHHHHINHKSLERRQNDQFTSFNRGSHGDHHPNTSRTLPSRAVTTFSYPIHRPNPTIPNTLQTRSTQPSQPTFIYLVAKMTVIWRNGDPSGRTHHSRTNTPNPGSLPRGRTTGTRIKKPQDRLQRLGATMTAQDGWITPRPPSRKWTTCTKQLRRSTPPT